MDFNVYLTAWIMIGNTEFNKVQSIEKVLHDIQRCVLLHVVTNPTNLFCRKLPETSTPQRHIQNLARNLIWTCLRNSQRPRHLLRSKCFIILRETRKKNCASIFNAIPECVLLTICFHLYCLRISKGWSMLHHRSVGQVQSKKCYVMLIYTFVTFSLLFFIKKLFL